MDCFKDSSFHPISCGGPFALSRAAVAWKDQFSSLPSGLTSIFRGEKELAEGRAQPKSRSWDVLTSKLTNNQGSKMIHDFFLRKQVLSRWPADISALPTFLCFSLTVMAHGGPRRCQALSCTAGGSDPLRDGFRLCTAHRKHLDALRSAGISARLRQERLAKKARSGRKFEGSFSQA